MSVTGGLISVALKYMQPAKIQEGCLMDGDVSGQLRCIIILRREYYLFRRLRNLTGIYFLRSFNLLLLLGSCIILRRVLNYECIFEYYDYEGYDEYLIDSF